METRLLGRSGLKLSVIGLGTMTFGGQGFFSKAGTSTAAEARRLLDVCLEAGVNWIDTADVYSRGVSEEICGEILQGRDRHVLVATKARFPMGDGPNDRGLSRHHLIAACEASLKRLGVPHIDIYQCHQWDGQTPVDEIVAALDTLVRHGKVRYVGCSNFSAWHIMKVLAAQDRALASRFVSQQIHYSVESRDAEYELVPVSVDQGLGILVWSPLAGGLLSGKYRRGVAQPADSRHLKDWGEPPIRDEGRLYDIVDILVRIGEARGISAATVALAWLLGRPAVTSLVIGARTEEQLRANLAAADVMLSTEERTSLDAVSAPPLLYPYWHQANTAGDRLSPADLTLLGPHLGAARL